MPHVESSAQLQHLQGKHHHLGAQAQGLQMDLSRKGGPAPGGSPKSWVGAEADSLAACDQPRASKERHLAGLLDVIRKTTVEIDRLTIAHQAATRQMPLESARTVLEASFVNEAEIVFTTLSSSGRR